MLTLFFNSSWQLFLIGFFYGIGHTIVFPTLSASFVDLANDRNTTSYNNVFLAFHLLGTLVVSSALGFVGDILGINSIFILMFFILIVTTLFIVFNKNKESLI
jgi:MFS family permease